MSRYNVKTKSDLPGELLTTLILVAQVSDQLVYLLMHCLQLS